MRNQALPLARVARTALPNGRRSAARLAHGCRRLAHDRDGVTALEYALMASLLAVVILGGFSGFSGSLGTLMSNSFRAIAASM